MKKFLSLMMMTLLCVAAYAGEVTDVITAEGLGISGSAYQTFTGKTFTSDAVYAGNISGNRNTNPVIQLNSNNDNKGIVVTTTGGKAKSITVTYNTDFDGKKTLNVYGKNEAYTAASDLYDRSTYGTQLGTITTTATFEIDGDYEYIGIRSASGAIYLDKIEVVWTVEDEPVVTAPEFVFTPEAGTYTEAQNVTVTVNNKPEDKVLLTSMGENGNWDRYSHTYNVTESTVIRAALVNDGEEVTSWYTIPADMKAEANYTINIPQPVAITFNPAAGEVEEGTQVTVTAANVPAGMKLFTRMGENSWSQYSHTYTINAAATIQAAVLDENTETDGLVWYTIPSDMKAEASYTIKVAPVVEPKIIFNPEAGEVEAGTEVTITVEGVEYDEIQYSLDGSTYSTYSAPVVINETCTLYAQAIYVDDNDIEKVVISGSARYSVVAPEPTPVITIDPNGGEFTNSVDVTVTVTDMPSDASIYYEFENAEGVTQGERMLTGTDIITVDESGYLTVRVVREAAEEAPMYKAQATGVLAELKSNEFIIKKVATGIEALTAGKAVKSVRYYNVAGQQAATAFEGMNIVVVNYVDGTQAVAKIVR